MDKEITFKGWVDLLTDTNSAESKSWVKRQVPKKWKKKFIILFSLAGSAENPRLGSYSKEEDNLLSLGKPKKSLLLHPLCKINKYYDVRGKKYVLVVSNNKKEEWYMSDDQSTDVVDKWATQIQMQSKLSRAISTCIYIVDCSESEEMKRIGAAQQKCILYFNKCGVTLALTRSRSILALWPLKTIRNYECSDPNKFSIEAGRRAPMGEGRYLFYTAIGKHQELFRIIDGFIVSALHEKASLPHTNTYEDNEDMQAYQRLYESAVGLYDNNGNHETLNLVPQAGPFQIEDTPTYNYIFEREDNSNSGSSIDMCDHSTPVRMHDKSTDLNDHYDNSTLNNNYTEVDMENNLPLRGNGAIINKYDKLDHDPSISRSLSSNYDNIDENNLHGGGNPSTYDLLDKGNVKSKTEVKFIPSSEYTEIQQYTPVVHKAKDNIETEHIPQFHPDMCQEVNLKPTNLQNNELYECSDKTDGNYDNSTLNNNSLHIQMQNNFTLGSNGAIINNYDKLDHSPNLSRSQSSNYDNINENNLHGGGKPSTYDLLNKSDIKSNMEMKLIPSNEYTEIEQYTPAHTDMAKEDIETEQYDVPQFHPDMYQEVNFKTTNPQNHEFRDTGDTEGEWYDNPSLCQSRASGVSLRSLRNDGKMLGSGTMLNNHSMQEIAEHFIYQMPSSLPLSDEVPNVGNYDNLKDVMKVVDGEKKDNG